MPNTAVAAARALFWLEEGDLGDGGKEEALRRTATAEASRHIMISYCWGPKAPDNKTWPNQEKVRFIRQCIALGC